MSNSPPGGVGGGTGGRESPSSTASSTTTTASGSGSVLGSVGSGGHGGSGCRHSGASFDSGRATSSTTHTQITTGVRYHSGGGGPLSSESSLGSFRHSYHSSNSSLGSIPSSEEIRNFDVRAMINQGVPDHEVVVVYLIN